MLSIVCTPIGIVFAAGAILATTLYLLIQHRFRHWERLGLPFVKPSFPFGNFFDTFSQRKNFSERSDDLYRSVDTPSVGIFTGLIPTLLVRDPNLIRSVLIRDFNNFIDRGVYCDEKREPLSAHLFGLPGEQWRTMRQKLSPTFTSGKLKSMFQTVVDCGVPLVTYVTAKAAAGDGSVIEARELLAQYTTNIIASVAFGLDVDCIGKPDTDFRHHGRRLTEVNFWNGVRGVMWFFCPPLLGWTGLHSMDNGVTEFILKMVRQNLEHREQNGVTRKDFFQLLVQLRNGGLEADGVWKTKIVKDGVKQLSVEQCAAQSLVFFLAGFETSSTTMSFALYELAKSPECQRRVQTEIDEVMARNGGELTYDSLGELRYLDWCIDETLRKYPPLPIITRECTESWTMANSDIVIEKGTKMLIPMRSLHMDPQYFPEPNTFDPLRFSPDRMDGSQTFAERPYMPFGEGPRNCVGQRLGKMQTKIGLVTMLQKFSYELAGRTKLELKLCPASFLLAPLGGINLKVSCRHSQ